MLRIVHFHLNVIVTAVQEENDLPKFLPNINRSDSRVSEIVLGGSRENSAFMRLNPFDDFGISRVWSSRGLSNLSHPLTIPNETTKPILSFQGKEQSLKKDEQEDLDIANMVQQTYFNRSKKQSIKKKKLDNT